MLYFFIIIASIAVGYKKKEICGKNPVLAHSNLSWDSLIGWFGVEAKWFNQTYYLMQAIVFSRFPILVHQIRPHQRVDM